MKKLTHTIIFFVALTLITAGFAPAQNAPDKASREEAIAARKEAEIARVEAEIAAKTAQKEVETARKQMEVTLKEVAEARSQVAKEQVGIDSLLTALNRVNIPPWQHRDGGAVLVVPAAELKVEDLAAITEDMTIMSRIFSNKLSQTRLTTGRGSWYVGDYNPFLGRDSGTTEAIYLEGYAALFLIKVNFPLSPSPEAQEEKKTEVEDTDPLWTETKQEIYAPEEAGRRRTDRPEEKYDAEKVAELKETLIKTLKHAANIRALKPDQSVILTVIGGQSQSGTRIDTRLYGRSGVSSNIIRGRSSRGRSTGRRAPGVPGTETGSFLPTVLTICAKKSDIDAFAKGELSFDQFQERTKIFTSYAKVGSVDLLGVEERQVAQVRASVF